MSLNLRSYTKNISFFITMFLLFSLSAFAQSVKPKPAKQPKKQNPPVEKLTTFNSAVAYKIWMDWYKAQSQGAQLREPTITFTYEDEEDFRRLCAIWDKAQAKAYKDTQALEAKAHIANLLGNTGLTNVVTNSFKTSTNPIYDGNGNLTSAGGRTYTYDYENRLIGITGNNLNVSLVYNGLGDLVSKTVNGVTTSYLVDRNNITGFPQVVEELQNGQVIKQYTYGANGIISQRQLLNGQRVVSFYGKDGHGSVRYLTDINGNITDTYDYDAFGNLINQTGNTPNVYLYTGERFDTDLGFYYLRARFLNTVTGRFLTQDTFEGNNEEPQSLHKYLYVQNDPVNKSDPSGLVGIADFAAYSIASQILNNIAVPQRLYNKLDAIPDDIQLDDITPLQHYNGNPVITPDGAPVNLSPNNQSTFTSLPSAYGFGKFATYKVLDSSGKTITGSTGITFNEKIKVIFAAPFQLKEQSNEGENAPQTLPPNGKFYDFIGFVSNKPLPVRIDPYGINPSFQIIKDQELTVRSRDKSRTVTVKQKQRVASNIITVERISKTSF